MKICVVLPCNIYTAPYYKRYEQLLISLHENFDFICWNRALIEEETKGNPIYFNVHDQVSSGKVTKIKKYIQFGNFVRAKLKETKYDKVIFLGSYAGIMAQLSGFLKKNYKNKYWLDIRDYTFENIPLYYKAMKLAIDNSYKTAISSPGYQKFLPKQDYVIGHNIDFDNIEKSKIARADYVLGNPIRISFIGLIRYLEENKKLLSILGNDNRFILQYYGMNAEILKEYCQINGISNVDFHGRFLPSETASFYKKTDIINNVYGNDRVALTTALSNKLYFSSGLRIPILVCPNTYMEKVTVERGFGFTIDYNDCRIGDKLYSWFMELQENSNDIAYDEFFESVKKEDILFETSFKEFIQL